MKRLIYILILVTLIISLGYFYKEFKENSLIIKRESNIEEDIINNEENQDTSNKDEIIKEDNIKEIDIVAVGDFLIHQEILETQYNEESDSYDFKNTIQYVKGYLENASLTIANMEGTLSGIENFGYSGYPSFNAPDELADTMKDAGIDLVNNMNNHTLDRSNKGFYRTRSFLEEKGFDVIGTRKDINESRYVIKDVDGIKVGVTSYSYTVIGEEGRRALNGIVIDEEVEPLMNTYRYDTVDSDLENMKIEIDKMKADGAEVIVFYMHWGDEYALEPNAEQTYMANYLASVGVDIIFGTHPHSIQPIDVITTESGKEVPVIYSMGNFLSSQRTERIQNPYTEDGVIVSVKVTKDIEGNIKIDYPKYLPTWVNWFEKEGKLFYEVVPANIDNADYLNDIGRIRVTESFNRTKGIIENYSDKVKLMN